MAQGIGDRVRKLRYGKGWGPDELAKASGISRTALYQIEAGKSDYPRAGTLGKLAGALGVDVSAIVGEAPTVVDSGRRDGETTVSFAVGDRYCELRSWPAPWAGKPAAAEGEGVAP